MPIEITLRYDTTDDLLREMEELTRAFARTTAEMPPDTQVVKDPPPLRSFRTDFDPVRPEPDPAKIKMTPVSLPFAGGINIPPPSPPGGVTFIPDVTIDMSGPVDSRGYAWDARIHNSVKTKKSDGTWKVKRGTPKELVARVESELANAAPPPAADVPAAPPADLTPPPAAADAVNIYARTCGKMSELIADQRLTTEEAQAMVTRHGEGATSIPDLAGNPTALAAIEAELDNV